VHIGLVISVLLHLAVLGWAVLTIQTQRDLRVAEPEPIAVDMMTPGEVTKLRQGVRTAKQMDAEAKETPKPPEIVRKEAPKPTPVVPKPEPPPEPPKEEAKPEPPKPEPPKEVVKAEPPKPEPPKVEPPKDPIAEKLTTDQPDPALEQARLEAERKAEEQKKLEAQKKLEEARKQAELKKKLDEEKKRKQAELKKKADDEKKRKEAEAKKKFDAENIAALLNKVPDKGAPPPSNTATDTPSKNKGPVLGAREGRDKELSASERAVLAQIIRSCVQAKWNLSGGGEDALNTVIKLRLQFRPDGTLSALPQVTNPQNTAYFLAASEGAVRAAQACEPYSLPPDKYEAWRDVLMTFSLREMMR
jgi:colicin import membrane protein